KRWTGLSVTPKVDPPRRIRSIASSFAPTLTMLLKLTPGSRISPSGNVPLVILFLKKSGEPKQMVWHLSGVTGPPPLPAFGGQIGQITDGQNTPVAKPPICPRNTPVAFRVRSPGSSARLTMMSGITSEIVPVPPPRMTVKPNSRQLLNGEVGVMANASRSRSVRAPAVPAPFEKGISVPTGTPPP